MISTRRKPTLADYQRPGVTSSPWRVMTWDELEGLFNSTLTESQNLGELIVAIQIGDIQRALDAANALIEGATP